MNDKLKAFIEAAQADPGLRDRLTKMGVGDLVAAAREWGFELSVEDFKPAAGEVSEEDLGNVAGGGFCACMDFGGGGGTDAGDDKIYGCACVIYGQGGDGRGGDANCFCVMGGAGLDSTQAF